MKENENKQNNTERSWSFNFKDERGNHCCLYTSTAMRNEVGEFPFFLWLNNMDSKPMIMADDAKRLGIRTSQEEGWIPFPLPDEVELFSAIHLTKDNIKELISRLSEWLEIGAFTSQK